MSSLARVALATVILLGCSKKTDDTPAPVEGTTTAPSAPADAAGAPRLEPRITHIEWQDMKADLAVHVPAGWVESSSGHFRPAGSPSMSGPSIAFAFGGFSCKGECNDADFQRERDALIDNHKKSLAKPNISTDKELDAVRLDVAEIERGTLPGGRFIAHQVTRPPGVTGPYYIGKVIVCSRFRTGDRFYIHAVARLHDEADQALWPLLVDACKSAAVK